MAAPSQHVADAYAVVGGPERALREEDDRPAVCLVDDGSAYAQASRSASRTDMTKIAVTGGSGKAGRVVVRDLFARGHQVLNIDQVGSPESNHPEDPIPFLRADVTDFGQALESLSGGDTLPGIEAVVHLAAIPSPAHATADQVFRTNATSTHAVFSAAQRLGLKKVVWASSETTLGLPFAQPPDYAPVDEKHMRPETSYALSKVVGEELARQFNRWSGIPIIGLRFSNVMIRDDYARFAGWQGDPHARKWNLWGYVDESHVAQSVRLALDADIDGTDNFIIAAADTVMRTPSRDLMEAVYPGVTVADSVSGNDTLLDIAHARDVLGYAPEFSWRDLD
jgi:nucleoside-diphosphate-sugar epimerase